MHTRMYDLDHNPIGVEQFGAVMADPRRHIARDVVGDWRVSTVFLGVDHGFGESDPLLYETMVFGAESWDDRYLRRYSTRAAAERGHADTVALIRAGRLDPAAG